MTSAQANVASEPASERRQPPDPLGILHQLEQAPRPEQGRTSQVSEFYSNRSVLITGASGFVGKVLIEKLLRACPKIKRIFVLIRPKWNKQAEERLRDLLETPLFDAVRDSLDGRIVLLEGDVAQENLGLAAASLARVLAEVSVVFHSAATVKFDEPLKQSVAINIAGTRNIIDLCRRLGRLAALVHVSTAYANCDRPQVAELVYPLEMEPERLIQMAGWLDQASLQELKRNLLGARPNTYTYTKALAEWLLVRQARDLPLAICRPSIVVASRSEPLRGWIDNVNGPTGVVLGAGKGLVRSMFAEKDFVADLVPVDVVISQMVALGWFAHLHHAHRSRAREGPKCQAVATQRKQQKQKQKLKQKQQQQRARLDDQLPPVVLLTDSSAPDDCDASLRTSGYNSMASSSASSDTASNHSAASLTIKHRRQHSRLERDLSEATDGASTDDDDDEDDDEEEEEEQEEGEDSEVEEKDCAEELERDGGELDFKLTQFRRRNMAKLAQLGLEPELADVPVFHCTSGAENPLTWGRIQLFIIAALAVFPSCTTYRYPCGSFTSCKLLDNFYRITLHYIPAYIVDLFTRLLGGKPMLVRIFQKFDQAAAVLRAFTSKQWHFDYDNKLFLFRELMSDEDRRLFDFDIKSLNWKEFSYDYVLGVRKFMLKEPMDSLDRARANLKKTYYRNLSLQVLFGAVFAYYFVTKFSGLLY